MRYQDKDRTKLRGIFPAESKPTDQDSKQSSPAVFSTTGQFYAIGAKGELVKRFEIILRSGKRYGISYSMLPISILADSSLLYIKAYELLITIAGRNLDPIHDNLTQELLAWVKTSASGKDDGLASTFVKDITVEGDAVSEYLK
ncbi:MAG: hypothetical protein R8N23_10450 [Reichenbachiella sp.]|uniref:hypothetical protein n=1 Tax=Reichenbachiella sp. TaxID=2184521 RepID=UPI0029672CA1|nr:hypothetical protein [Reichenbachiella sp.]MDW3210278.1 hypothetical protein [Reichenbachiella sp.]